MTPTNKPNTGTAIPPSETAVPPSETAVPPSGTPNHDDGQRGNAPTAAPSFTEIALTGQGQSTAVRYAFLDLLSKVSGEAFVYLVSNGGTRYVLKLFKPHRHPNHDVLETLVRFRSDYNPLVNMYAHGLWTNPATGWTHDFAVMQYCSGGPLSVTSFHGKEKELAKVAVEMAAAIDFCHKHNILHRDIKPSNFLYTDTTRRRIALVDFGIAMTLDSDGNLRSDSKRPEIDEARTVVYAAPEMYYRTMHGFSPTVSFKSDFYSLGLSLMALWMGEASFTADETRLVAMKNSNSLVYPSSKEMSRHMLSLLMALTRCNPDERASMPEIARWAKGEDIFDVPSDEDGNKAGRFRVPFDVKQGLVAHSPKELARIMGDNPDTAKRYLYQDQIGQWLKEFEMYPEASAMEDITERLYADNRDGGLYAARLVLDPATPYPSLDGNGIGMGAIGKELLKHEDEYGSLLEDSTHPLWAFLYANLGESNIETTPDDIGASLCGVPSLAYELDNTLPFEFGENGRYRYFNSLPQIVEAARKGLFTNKNVSYFVYDDFAVWLKHHDMAVYSLVKDQIDSLPDDGSGISDDEARHCLMGWVTLYTIAFNCGYDFLPVDGGSHIIAPTHIASEIMAEVAGNANQGFSFTRQLDQGTFRQSRLCGYLMARKKYQSKVRYVEYCIDLKSENNSSRYGPYNKQVACMKAAASMAGQVLPLRLEAEGKELKDKDDVAADTSLAKLQDNRLDLLADWLTLSFAENPYADYKRRSYFDLTADYFDFIRLHLKQCGYIKRAKGEIDKIDSSRRSCNMAWGKLRLARGLIVGVCIVPLVVLNVALAVLSIKAGSAYFTDMMTSAGTTLGWVFGIAVALYIMADTSFIGGVIGGVLTYHGISFVCSRFGFLAPWVGVATLATLTLKAVTAINFSRRPPFRDNSFGFSENEATKRHLMGMAFGSHSALLPEAPYTYPCNIYDNSRNEANARVSPLWKKAAKLIGLTVVAFGMCTYVATGIANNTLSPSTESASEMRERFPGTWTGTMGKTKATLNLKKSPTSESHVTGTIRIEYKKPVTQIVVADGSMFDNKGMVLRLYVVEGNKENKRKRYCLKLTNGSGNTQSLSGSYTNELNGNRQSLVLSKTEAKQ